jgi:hypothetical protein
MFAEPVTRRAATLPGPLAKKSSGSFRCQTVSQWQLRNLEVLQELARKGQARDELRLCCAFLGRAASLAKVCFGSVT